MREIGKNNELSISQIKHAVLTKAVTLFFLIASAKGALSFDNNEELARKIERFRSNIAGHMQRLPQAMVEQFKQAIIAGNNHANNASIYLKETPLESTLTDNQLLQALLEKELTELRSNREMLNSALLSQRSGFLNFVLPLKVNLSPDDSLFKTPVIEGLVAGTKLNCTPEIEHELSNILDKQYQTTTHLFKKLNVDPKVVAKRLKELEKEKQASLARSDQPGEYLPSNIIKPSADTESPTDTTPRSTQKN